MMPRPALVLVMATLLGGCAGGEIPIYVGDERVGTFPGTGAAVSTASGGAQDECQRVALRAADPAITDAQRRAAAEYRASLGC